MAEVLIPVVIDIESAFEEAAKRVSTASKPLQQAIDENTAKIKLTSGYEWNELLQKFTPIKKSLEDIIGLTEKLNEKTGKTTYSLTATTKELSIALEDARNKYARLSAMEEKGIAIDYNKLDAYREAIPILMSEISLRERNVALVEKAARAEIEKVAAIDEGNYALIREANTVADLTNKISALRGMLNNLNPDDKKWKSTADEIKSATKQLEQYKKKLDKILNPSSRPPLIGSIDRINLEMQKLEKQWNAMSKKVKFDANGELSAKAKDLIQKYKDLAKEAEKFGISLKKAATDSIPALQKQHSILSDIGRTFGTYISVHSLLRFARGIRDVTGELEYQRVALGHLLKDVAYGNYLFERTKEAAIESPFRIKDLVTYTKQLAAYRIEQENLFDTSKRLADISAGLGVEMNRLILAYGQVRAASVLRGQELRQFTEAGIPLVELLAEKFTDLRGEMVTTGDVFKLISERAVPFSMIADIFEDLTEKGGMFYKMQEEQAKTLKGRWEKLKDAYDIALQSVGDTTTFQRLNDVILGGLTLLAKNMRVLVKLVEGAAVAYASYNAIVLITAKRVAAVATAEQSAAIAEMLRTRNVSGLIVKLMGQAAAEKALTAAATQATIGTNALSRALGRLKVALITNPWAIAGAAILGVVMALTQFKKASDDATEAINTLNRAADDLHIEKNRQERVRELIDLYKSLSEETERNAAQNETLERTMKKLAEQFPEMKERITNNNLSLEERLQLVKDLNEEEEKRLKNLIDEKEAELKAGRTKLSYAQGDLDVAEEAKKDATNYYNSLQEKLEDLASRGEKGRGWFSKALFGGNEYDQLYSALVRAREYLDQTEKSYNEAKGTFDSLTESVDRLDAEIHGTQKASEEIFTGWKKDLEKMQNTTKTKIQLFTPEQLEGWHRLYDVSNDLEKEWKKLKEDVDGLSSSLEHAKKEGSDTIGEYQKDLDIANEKLAGLEFIREFFKFVWGKKEKQPKDNRLTNLKKDISEITNAYKKFVELREYMGKEKALIEIDKLFPQLKGWEPTLDKTLNELNKKLDDVKAKLKRSPKDSVLLDMQRTLETEISNLKFDNLKREITDKLKNLSDEIKQSEQARNFYEDILGLTGDKELAANLSLQIYGSVGDDFKKRIQEEIKGTFDALDASETAGLSNAVKKAVETGDLKMLMSNIDQLPNKLATAVRSAADATEKYNADIAKSYGKLLMEYDDIEQQRVNISNKSKEKRLAIERGLQLEIEAIYANKKYSDEEADRLVKQASDRARRAYEAIDNEEEEGLLKLSNDYRMFFNSVGVLSKASARRIANTYKKLLTEQFENGEISLSKFNKEWSQIESRLKEYENDKNPFVTYLTKGIDGLLDKLSQYRDGLSAISGHIDKDKGLASFTEDDKEYINKMGKIFGGKIFGVAGRKNVFEAMSEEFGDNVGEMSKHLDNAAESIQNISSDFGVTMGWVDLWVNVAGGAISALDKISKFSKNTAGEVSEDWNTVGKVMLTAMSLGAYPMATNGYTGDEMERLASLNEKAMEGFEKFKKGDIVGSILDNIEGWAEVFGINTAKINREIKQQSKLLEDLEYEYKRVDVAIQKAFGSDYIQNYNKQLEILKAEAEAYRKQAELERSKDKKADEETAKGYEDKAREVEDRIEDLKGSLADFFAGTDVTSAATDFANAWIEAYKEFGSTTDAMREKFTDMLESMVTNSLAAKVMQEILQPLFDQIDEMAKEGDELSASEIAQIAANAPEYIERINGAMTTLMNQLAAAGYNVRTQAGQFTGISRNIAGATEESITGLAAGINTQNFYMSHIDANVALILSVLTGGNSTGGASITGEVIDPYKDSMLQYASYIPQMHDDMYAVRSLLEKVIKPKGVSAQHYVATNL